MATSPDAARITTSKGSIGCKLVAADYHKLLSDLMLKDHGEVKINDGESCIKNEYVLVVNIKAR